MDANPSLQVRLHLDLNRSTRPGPDSTAAALVPLLEAYPDRIRVSLFRSPKLKGLMAKIVPPRFNEGWGTWHPKIYCADDDVLISGLVLTFQYTISYADLGYSRANLNESYFSNRQDRYILLSSQPYIAQYCLAFLQTVAGFSYRLLPPKNAGQRYHIAWTDPKTHPHHIEEKAQRALVTLQDAYRLSSTFRTSTSPSTRSQNGSTHDTLIFPIIQAGQFNIREEERALALLFNELSTADHARTSGTNAYGGPLVDLTTGYFGLYRPYRDLVLRSQFACRIVASSPKVCKIDRRLSNTPVTDYGLQRQMASMGPPAFQDVYLKAILY